MRRQYDYGRAFALETAVFHLLATLPAEQRRRLAEVYEQSAEIMRDDEHASPNTKRGAIDCLQHLGKALSLDRENASSQQAPDAEKPGE